MSVAWPCNTANAMTHVLRSPELSAMFSGYGSDMNVPATGIADLTALLSPPNPANG